MILDILVGALVACGVYFIVRGLVVGVRMVATAPLPATDDPADQMSPAMRAQFDAFNAAIDQAIAIANSSGMPYEPRPAVDYEARWLSLIDPDSPDYNALAEWAHNIHPSLRKVRTP